MNSMEIKVRVHLRVTICALQWKKEIYQGCILIQYRIILLLILTYIMDIIVIKK